MAEARGWLAIGRLVKPHGLHGALAYRAYNPESDILRAGVQLRAMTSDGLRTLSIARMRPFKAGAIVEIEGVDDLRQAETLRDAELWVPRSWLGALDDDEVFVQDLIGLEAVLPDGRAAGNITDAVDTGPVVTLIVEGAMPGAVPYHDDWVGDPDWMLGQLPLRRKPIR